VDYFAAHFERCGPEDCLFSMSLNLGEPGVRAAVSGKDRIGRA